MEASLPPQPESSEPCRPVTYVLCSAVGIGRTCTQAARADGSSLAILATEAFVQRHSSKDLQHLTWA